MNKEQAILLILSAGVIVVSASSFFIPVFDYGILGMTILYMGYCLWFIRNKSKFKSTKINLGSGKGFIVPR